MSRRRSRREKLQALALQHGLVDGFHFVDVEPKLPFRAERKLRVRPDAVYEAQLERDMRRLWQIHEATTTWPAYRATWPDRITFLRNWPLLALDLVVADWKVRRAFSPLEVEAIPAEILMPPRPPEREPWQKRYAAEIERYPALGWALQQSLDAVFRRAKLTPTYATALRMWLQGESDQAIGRAIHRRSRFVAEIRTKALAAVLSAFRLPENVIAGESNPFVQVGRSAQQWSQPTSTPSSASRSSNKLAG